MKMKYTVFTVSLFVMCFLSLFFLQCSEQYNPDQMQVLNEIPQHIQEIENLTIFPGDSEPEYSVELVPVQRFGVDGEPYLTSIIGGAVDEDGRLIILDVNFEGGTFPPDNRIIVYRPDGTYLTQIGRSGQGPGEFGLTGIPQVNAGKVFVVDISNRRLNIYSSSDYSFERTSLLEEWSARGHEAVRDLEMGSLFFRHDGNLLARFIDRVPDNDRPKDLKFLLVNTDGDVLNPDPLVFPSGFTIRPQTVPPGPSISLPFMGTTITALSPDDALYSAWSQDFLIKKHGADGVYQSAIYYPVTGSPFDLNDHTESTRYNLSDIRNAFDNSAEELPESNIILVALRVDDKHRIWAGVQPDPKQEFFEWWILGPSGKLLAKLQHPKDQQVIDIKEGHLYNKETDEDTGAEFVVKYRMEFREAE